VLLDVGHEASIYSPGAAGSIASPVGDRLGTGLPGVVPYRDAVPTVATWTPPTRRRVRAVRDRLRAVYGIPRMAPHGDPLAELVLTVLSQSTNDRNRDVAYLRLRARLPTWEAVRDAPVEAVEEAIRPGGISRVKSRRIQSILRAIAPAAAAGDKGGATEDPRASAALSLSWLAHAPLEEARDYLTGLPGVGRKTAACVLLFAYGRHEVPVDTHVSRVGTRLALLRAGAPFAELHDQMLALTPPGEELELHVNLLRHGRRTCHARGPACGTCALARMCPSRGLQG
jgi:endonuclease-3